MTVSTERRPAFAGLRRNGLVHRSTIALILYCTAAVPASAGGLLRIHPDNPRYFTDDSGRQHLVYLSPGGRNQAGKWSPLPKPFFFEGPADVTAVTRSWNRRYLGDPPVKQPGATAVHGHGSRRRHAQ